MNAGCPFGIVATTATAAWARASFDGGTLTPLQALCRCASWLLARSLPCRSASAWSRFRSSSTRRPRARRGVSFNLLAKDGSRLKQQYVSEKDQNVVERAEMVKGYEFEKDRFVHLPARRAEGAARKARATRSTSSPSFPDKAVDPIYYDKAYFLAPDKRGGKPYNLLMRGDARERPLRARQVGLEGQAVRGPGARRPKTAWCCSSCSTPTRCAR